MPINLDELAENFRMLRPKTKSKTGYKRALQVFGAL